MADGDAHLPEPLSPGDGQMLDELDSARGVSKLDSWRLEGGGSLPRRLDRARPQELAIASLGNGSPSGLLSDSDSSLKKYLGKLTTT